MLIAVNGLVIRENACKEHDKILSVLTAERGKLSVYCHGVRSVKNRNMTSCQLFCYSEFIIEDKQRDMYTLKEASLIENFFKIREDLRAFAFAQYAVSIASEAATEEAPEGDLLKLLLNTLYISSQKDADIAKIKAAFELRCALVLGFLPDLLICADCGRADAAFLLDIPNGRLLCADCAGKEITENGGGQLVPISPTVLSAMRYISAASDKRWYSFSIPDSYRAELADICEKFLIYNLERGFSTLDFYKTIDSIQ